MKRQYVIPILCILLLVTGIYFYVRFGFLRSRDFKPENSKAESLLDLRPSIIARLQQLIKDGSDGLYVLSVEKIDPDIIASKLNLFNGSITVDTAAMDRLDELGKLPENIFFVSFRSLEIEGLGMNDLKDGENMDIKKVNLDAPEVHIYRQTRPYTIEAEKAEETTTLYQRLMKDLKRLAIGDVNVKLGKLIVHNQDRERDRPDQFNNVSIVLKDLLIDSSTQFDHDRFLFAKKATIHTRDFKFRTPDDMYDVKLGDVTLSGETHRMTILNAEMKPRYGQAEFEKKLKQRDEMYNIVLPKITVNNVSWWEMVNHERIMAGRADVYGGAISVFVNKSLPLGEPIPTNRYPHQLVMMVPIPVLISELKLHGLQLKYRQYMPETSTTAGTEFTAINGTITNVTNIPAEIRKDPIMQVTATARFMDQAPLHVKIRFDLARHKTGNFTAVISMDTLNKETVNPVSEPIGRFTVKRGQMQKATAHFSGDNKNIHARISFCYDNLHLTPLRIDSLSGNLKKAHLKSFVANILFIKNENPDEGEPPREQVYDISRGAHEGFVSYIWMAIVTGLCKTIGIPAQAVIKER